MESTIGSIQEDLDTSICVDSSPTAKAMRHKSVALKRGTLAAARAAASRDQVATASHNKRRPMEIQVGSDAPTNNLVAPNTVKA